MATSWSQPISPEIAYRRAGGRRHYNAWKKSLAMIRRSKVAQLIRLYPPFHNRGMVSAIARELGVHPSTICRDIQALNQNYWLALEMEASHDPR